MAQVIALVNQKGGVGKTTTALNLGAYLAEAQKHVLLVDSDPQGNATSGVGIRVEAGRAGLYEVLSNQVQAKAVIQKSPVANLSIFPSTQTLAAANVELVNVENREFLLREALLGVRNDYDYILIDCPPSLGILTINGLAAADDVVIPVQSEYYALEGLGQLLETIHLVQQNLNKDLRIMGAVVTMHDRRTKLSAQVLKEMNRHFPNKVFDSVIPRNIKLSEAPSHGQTIRQYEPWSKGAKAYRRLAEEILRQDKV
ncbi:ParA family protein [Patescibacteria group bacterium]